MKMFGIKKFGKTRNKKLSLAEQKKFDEEEKEACNKIVERLQNLDKNSNMYAQQLEELDSQIMQKDFKNIDEERKALKHRAELQILKNREDIFFKGQKDFKERVLRDKVKCIVAWSKVMFNKSIDGNFTAPLPKDLKIECDRFGDVKLLYKNEEKDDFEEEQQDIYQEDEEIEQGR